MSVPRRKIINSGVLPLRGIGWMRRQHWQSRHARVAAGLPGVILEGGRLGRESPMEGKSHGGRWRSLCSLGEGDFPTEERGALLVEEGEWKG